MVKRTDWISAGLAMALVIGYALWTRPGARRPQPIITTAKTLATTRPVSLVYDVRDVIEQVDAYSTYKDSLLTDKQRAVLVPLDNAMAIRDLLFIQDAKVGPVIDGRVCVVAPERTHALIECLLHQLRQLNVPPTEIKP